MLPLPINRPWPPLANPLEGNAIDDQLERSVAVRAAYAFGEWPPVCDDPTCLRPDRHVRHIEDVDAAEAAPAIREPAA